MHVPWSIRALKANKHVLCEKPIGLSVAEAEQLAGVAAAHPKLKVMEAFMYRLHPQWLAARELVRDGRIGALRTIHTIFSYFNDDPANIRNQRDIGGGALMDIGCYPISLSRFIFDAEPRTRARPHRARPEARHRPAHLRDPRVLPGHGHVHRLDATRAVPADEHLRHRRAGSKSKSPSTLRTIARRALWLQTGTPPAAPIEEQTFETCDMYTIQADAFARAILDDTPVPTPLADAVANMRVIERIRTSAETNAWS